MHRFALATAALLALAVAGCGSGENPSHDRSIGAFLNSWPAGRNFTGQGDMGIGVMGNSEGESGPSQVLVPDWGHGRGATQ